MILSLSCSIEVLYNMFAIQMSVLAMGNVGGRGHNYKLDFIGHKCARWPEVHLLTIVPLCVEVLSCCIPDTVDYDSISVIP